MADQEVNKENHWKNRFFTILYIWIITIVLMILVLTIAKSRIDELLYSNPIDQINEIHTEIDDLQYSIDKLQSIVDEMEE